MLECSGCRRRFVVYDTWLEFVGTADGHFPDEGEGYGDVPLTDRCRCVNGCADPLHAIGSLDSPTDRAMWLHSPHIPVTLTPKQSDEWRQLIAEYHQRDRSEDRG
jgi:hypothetical protein